ncbi:hypothetical protein D5S17_05525 [Pseudonocardiaceae bacterium YIM PH 21723]|nr:hypothetical protein D5S17_05525 [Pseudonocardiaceae bacterium YIM PH 21723]
MGENSPVYRAHFRVNGEVALLVLLPLFGLVLTVGFRSAFVALFLVVTAIPLIRLLICLARRRPPLRADADGLSLNCGFRPPLVLPWSRVESIAFVEDTYGESLPITRLQVSVEGRRPVRIGMLGWRVDVAELRGVLATVAPGVPLDAGNLTEWPQAEGGYAERFRLTWELLAAIGFAAVVLVLVLLFGGTFFAIVVPVLAALPVIRVLVCLFRGQPPLRVDARGLRFNCDFSDQFTVPWTEIQAIRVVGSSWWERIQINPDAENGDGRTAFGWRTDPVAFRDAVAECAPRVTFGWDR